jgi:hypothetical protein
VSRKLDRQIRVRTARLQASTSGLSWAFKRTDAISLRNASAASSDRPSEYSNQPSLVQLSLSIHT